MKRAQIILYFIFLFAYINSYGQPECDFEHFSTHDGLPQFTINDIVQDNKGFIWLATYDGISKFDGYGFHNYKAKIGDSIQMKSNRVDKIYVDNDNRIWMESTGREVHCFNPKTEKFWGLSNNDSTINAFTLSKILVQSSGKVWLLSSQTGCICILDSLYNRKKFSLKNKNISDNSVNLVHEDKNGNSWLLTNNGLTFINSFNNDSLSYYFVSTKTNEPHLAFISAFEFDEEIWFGTDNGKLFRYLKADNVFIPLQINATSSMINIGKLDQNTLFFATQNDGFFTYDIGTRIISTYNNKNVKGFNTENIELTYISKPDKVWFSNKSLGIYKLNLSSRKLDYYFVKTDDVSIATYPQKAFILTDKKNQLWVHPHGGGFSFYDEKSNQLKPFFNEPFSNNSKFSNMLHSGYFDRQGNLWMGTRSHGLEKIVFNKSHFRPFKVEPSSNSLFENNIRVLFTDKNENIWISSKENKIDIYSSALKKIGCLSPGGNFDETQSWPNTVYCIFQDSNNTIWLGTRGAGIYKFIPTNKPYVFRVEHFFYKDNDNYSLSNNNVYSIYEDKHNRLWVATFGGGLNLIDTNEKEIRFLHSKNVLKTYPQAIASKVRNITEDLYGHICLGTTEGLLIFNSAFDSLNNTKFHLFQRIPGKVNSLSNNDIIDIHITKAGEMYLATSGGGLNVVTSYTSEGLPEHFKAFTKEGGIPSDIVVSITEDFTGKLWIGCENALCRYDPKTAYFEVFTDVRRLLNDNSFSEATNCVLKTGEILIGYSDGIISFFPEEIKTDYYTPYLSLSNLRIFNKKVPIDATSPLKVDIDDCKELILTHKQNFFSIEYAALDFINPKNIQYEYMLEGLDQKWYKAGTNRIANYTNVPKGEYLFKVRSTNGEGVWIDNERSLPIIIKPSFWETPIAYSLYFLVFAIIIFLIDYNLLTIYQLKSKIVLEKKISDMKQKFFVDISHEIRTPLTLITAPVEYMLNDTRTPEPIKKQLTYISQNSNRMLRLVNQILDLRKLQDSKLKVQEIDLTPFIYELYNRFSELTKENNIVFEFKNLGHNEKIWADKDSLEKIISNLLSNAFKYTPNGKSITIKLTADEKFVTISVFDKGTGISIEKQKKLFIRFMSFNQDASKPSTGIGLALIKELADKHMAKISVESEVGKGSCFSISFQKGNQHFKDNVEYVAESHSLITSSIKRDQITPLAQLRNTRQSKVLIVEDESDLRHFITNILEEQYEILQAEDGVQGFELAIKNHPDFIISDIMMPRMDGIELLKKLRNDINTSHIPIILLTAKTNIESKLEGMTYGADDYITKPFSIPYFKTRISNLLEQRKRLQEIFNKGVLGNIKEYNPKPYLISNQDEELMEKVMSIIEANIDKVNFTVEELIAKIGINRTTFQNKTKSLTGFSPVEFIRDIRLKRSEQLIVESALLIKEIAYMTGFTDTRYFSKCFRTKYGLSPLEYRNQEKIEN